MANHVNRWCIWCIFLSSLLYYGTVLVSLWFTWKVLMKCFTRGIHWGAATQCVILDLGNGFTEIISLTWHWMCNLWVSEVRFHGLALSVLQKLNTAFFLLQGFDWEDETIDIQYTQMWRRLYILLASKYSVASNGISYLYCLLTFLWLLEHPIYLRPTYGH